MIFAKDTTYGLDSSIKILQQNFEDELIWISGNTLNSFSTYTGNQVASSRIHIYGKIQRTLTDNGFIPEAYTNPEYKQIFIDDTIAATIGFYVTNRPEQFKADIDIICTMNLREIHNDDLRNEEKALLEFTRALKLSGMITEITGVKEGVQQVFSDFNQESISYRDMQPWYIFSVSTQLRFKDDYC